MSRSEDLSRRRKKTSLGLLQKPTKHSAQGAILAARNGNESPYRRGVLRQSTISMKRIVPIAILSLIGMILVYKATANFGVGVSPDSVLYISVANDITKDPNPQFFMKTNLTIAPPLYPATLAATDLVFGEKTTSSARIINIILAGLIIFLSGILFIKHFASAYSLALTGTAFVLVSVPIFPVLLMAWTEPLFICLVLMYIIFLEHFLDTRSGISLFCLSVSVALACLTRYAGVILIAAGATSIVLFYCDTLKNKLGALLTFILLSGFPLTLWTLRNYLIANTPFGPREASSYTRYQNLTAISKNIINWYLPLGNTTGQLSLVLFGGMLCLLISGLVAIWLRDKTDSRWYGSLLAYIISYTAFLTIISRSAFTQAIDNRYLSPIYIPLTLLLVFTGHKIIALINQNTLQKYTGGILALAVSLSLIYSSEATISTAAKQWQKGAWYTSKSWRNSRTISYIENNRLSSNCTIYSNGTDAISFLTDLQAKSVPVKTSSPDTVTDIESLKGNWPPENTACIVWFDNVVNRTYYFAPEELLEITHLEKVVSLGDGTIYYISKK